MDLSIIIVNWHSSDYLRKCLNSLSKNINEISFEVIVVDNASYDDCEEMIRAEFPSVRFIQSGENMGFAKANNLGYSHSTGNTLLFLNPDTEVIDFAVKSMYSSLQSIRDAGIVGCRLLNSDLSVQLSCIQPATTILREIVISEYLMLRFPKLKFWGIRPLLYYQGYPEEVEGVIGACLMITRKTFEKVGKFNEEYFMYAEDMEICSKVKKLGYKIYFVGNAEIIHHGGKSSIKQEENCAHVIIMFESTLKYLTKNKSKFYAVVYRIAIGCIALLRLSFIKILLFFLTKHANNDKLVIASRKWQKLFLCSIGLS